MRIVFCLSGFGRNALYLQPWVTVYQVARQLVIRGHNVDIITDRSGEETIDNIVIHEVKSLRGYDSAAIELLLEDLKPDIVIVSVSPLSLISAKWYRVGRRYSTFAYISYPFYTVGETLKAFPYLTKVDMLRYGRHIIIPGALWGSRLKAFFQGVICQSEKTKRRLAVQTGGSIQISVIPPGVDNDWIDVKTETPELRKPFFLYVGTPSSIRGFSLVLEALKRIGARRIQLRVLARGADSSTIEGIRSLADKMGLKGSISIRGGWLEKKELQDEMKSAFAVLMPFALVPSELPISVFESICCETPLIVSDIDGLSEAVGGCGIAVSQCNAVELSQAMTRLHDEEGLRDRLVEACRKRKNSIRVWEEVSTMWFQAVGL